MARFGDGLATDRDLGRAAERAVEQALAPLDASPDLVCVFASGDDADQLEAAGRRVASCCPDATLVGCSAYGVIGGARGVEEAAAVSVWAGVLPDVQLRSFHLEVIRLPEGMAVVGMPEPRPDDGVVVLLADPLSFPADGFVEQANDALPGLPIVGGLAWGSRGPGSTRLFHGDRVVDRGAVGVVLGGGVAARPLVSQGCRPVGPTMVVTKADGNAVLELAGVSAIAKLEQIVDDLEPVEQAMVSGGLHFGIAMDEYAEEHEKGDFLVRGVVGADRERGAIVIGDVVEVGRTVRFQVRDADAADADLRDMLTRFEPGASPVEGALLFSCNGRGAHLFGTADHDVSAVREVLGIDGVGGFFAAGEFGPVGGRNHLHGFTASMLAFLGEGGDAGRPAG